MPTTFWVQSALCCALLALQGCGGDSPPPPAGPGDDEPADASSGVGSTPTSGFETSEAQTLASGARDAGTDLDGGAYFVDASTEPIIGVIDASGVTLVEAEAAAPLTPGCTAEEDRDLQVAGTLPEGAIGLSVTPDGKSWAYAVRWLGDEADASAADSGMESSGSFGETYAVHVETPNGQLFFVVPADFDPTLGAALSADATRLVLTRADRRGFAAWDLAETANTFEPAVTQPFVRLNALAANGGVRFEKPAFSTSGDRLYARETQPNTALLQLVIRDGQWETEVRNTQSALQTQEFFATAASSDDLTVFGWSAVDGRAVAWWRPRASEPFEASLSVGPARVYAVSSDCQNWWTLVGSASL